MNAKLAAALAAGRDAVTRMRNATSDEDYLNAAAALGDAFDEVDRILTNQQKRK